MGAAATVHRVSYGWDLNGWDLNGWDLNGWDWIDDN